MPANICVIGSSNVDFTVKSELLPGKGETVSGGVFQHAYGGKGANQAVAASRAGGRVSFVACLGKDEFTGGLLKAFKKDRIDTKFVFSDPGAATGVALIMVDRTGDNYIAVASGANHRLLPRHVDLAHKAVKDAAYVILQMEIPAETNSRVIDLCSELDVKVIVNCAPFRPLAKDQLSRIDILIVNEHEAAGLTGIKVEGEKSAVKAAEALSALGVKNAIITLGANGSIVYGSRKAIPVPAFKIRALDATAAGDTFCGALAVRLTEGASLAEASRFASAAAALACTRLGAQSSIPIRKEIDRFLAEHP